MRTSSLLLILIYFSASAQVVLSTDKCMTYVESKMASFRMTLWNAALDGTTTVYRNDSLSTPLAPNDIEMFTTIDTKVEVLVPDDSEPPNYTKQMKSVRVSLEPEDGLQGIKLLYNQELSNGKIAYHLEAVAPLWEPMTASGIQLGLQPLFWMKMDDLKNLISSEDFTFYKALFTLRSSFGDFKPEYPSAEYFEVGSAVTNKAFGWWSTSQNFVSFHDSAMGFHISRVLEFAAQQAVHSAIFYKDEGLTEKYADLAHDVNYHFVVMVPDTASDKINDPTAMMPMSVPISFEFAFAKEVIIENNIVHFIASPNEDWAVDEKDKKLVHVYTKWSDLEPRIPKLDQEILQYIINEQ